MGQEKMDRMIWYGFNAFAIRACHCRRAIVHSRFDNIRFISWRSEGIVERNDRCYVSLKPHAAMTKLSAGE
jgi:hypothetical protein